GRAAHAQGITHTSDPETFYAMVSLAQRDVNSRIESVLGKDGFQEYSDFESSLGKRMTIQRLADSVANTDPITDAQADNLLRLMVAAKDSPVRGDVGMGIDSVINPDHQRLAEISKKVVQEAKPILSDTQYHALKDLREQLRVDKSSAS